MAGKLERTLGLTDILMFGIGGIVGAGIYAIVGEAAGLAGGMLWLSFAIAAIVALLTGLTYAEFVSQFPDAGGSFEYVKQSMGERVALGLSVVMLLTGIIAPAAIAISFSSYLSRLVDFPPWISTLGVIGLMAIVNIVGVKHSSWFNFLATGVTLLGLGSVIVFSLPQWSIEPLIKQPDTGSSGILAGSALIFFSYVGFEDLVKMAEETKSPEKTLPRGIAISGVFVLAIYVLIAISCVNVVEPKKLAESDGPLAQVLSSVAGESWGTGLVVVALFATSKTVMSNVLGTSRLLYDVSRDSGFAWLKKLTRVNGSTGTPIFATIAIAFAVAAFAMIGNLKMVASMSNVFVLLLFLAVNCALIVFRKTHAEGGEAPFRVPLNIGNVPVPTLLAITGLLVLMYFNIRNLL